MTFAGNKLEHGHTVDDYDMRDECMVQLALRTQEDEGIHVCTTEGKVIEIEGETTISVAEAKLRIQ